MSAIDYFDRGVLLQKVLSGHCRVFVYHHASGLDLARDDQNCSIVDQYPDLGIPPLIWVWTSGKVVGVIDGIPRLARVQ